MKGIDSILIRSTLLANLLLITLVLNAQWHTHPSPLQNNISVDGIFETNGKQFATTNCGIYFRYSTNDAWQLYSDLLVDYCYIINDTLFGSHRYETDGISYDLFYFDLKNEDPEPISLSYDSDTRAILRSHNRLFVGDGNFGFRYFSENNWTTNNEGLPIDSVYDWEGGGYYYYHRVYGLCESENSIYAATQKGVYKTDPYNIQWTPTFLINKSIFQIKRFNDTLYAVTENQIYYSPDIGNTWTMCYQGNSIITDFHVFNNMHYVATESNGILVSANFNEWNSLDSGLEGLYINCIDNTAEMMVCGTQDSGYYYLSDGHWLKNNTGIINSKISRITSTTAGLVYSRSGIGDQNIWFEPIGSTFIDVTPQITDLRYFGNIISVGDSLILSYGANIEPWYERNRFLIMSKNNGESWYYPANQPPEWGDDTYRLVKGLSGYYAYEDDKLYYSDDLGKTWTDMSVPSAYCNHINSVVEFRGSAYLSACADAEVLKWTNGIWELDNTGLPMEDIQYLFGSDSSLYAYNYNQTFVLNKTTDSWEYFADPITEVSYIYGSVSYKDKIIVNTTYGIYYIEDGGNKWVDLNKGLPARKIMAMDIFRDTLFVATKRSGIWKQAVEDLHLEIFNDNSIIKNLVIYPNPTTNSFIVKTSDIINSDCIIDVFDITGRKIAYLFEPNIQSGISIDSYNWDKGLYIIKLKNKDGYHAVGNIVIH